MAVVAVVTQGVVVSREARYRKLSIERLKELLACRQFELQGITGNSSHGNYHKAIHQEARLSELPEDIALIKRIIAEKEN